MYIANHCCSQLTAAAACCFGALQDPAWNLQCIGRPLRDPLLLQQQGRPRNWSQHWCSYRWVGVPDDGYALPSECAGAACSWTSSRFMAAGTCKSICDATHVAVLLVPLIDPVSLPLCTGVCPERRHHPTGPASLCATPLGSSAAARRWPGCQHTAPPTASPAPAAAAIC